jgi:uncharacterized protein (TIGR03437 family)
MEKPLSRSLGGATVSMNGAAVPIFITQPSAVYVQVPQGVRADSVTVRVVNVWGGVTNTKSRSARSARRCFPMAPSPPKCKPFV